MVSGGDSCNVAVIAHIYTDLVIAGVTPHPIFLGTYLDYISFPVLLIIDSIRFIHKTCYSGVINYLVSSSL